MERWEWIRSAAMGICAAAGGLFSAAFGGWTSALTTLVIFMGIDYCTGIIAAGVFHASSKSESGALESRAGFKGLCRKGMMLLMVLLASRLDALTGGSMVRDAVAAGFVMNEGISILENAALCGVQYPKALEQALELLREGNEKNGISSK